MNERVNRLLHQPKSGYEKTGWEKVLGTAVIACYYHKRGHKLKYSLMEQELPAIGLSVETIRTGIEAIVAELEHSAIYTNVASLKHLLHRNGFSLRFDNVGRYH